MPALAVAAPPPQSPSLKFVTAVKSEAQFEEQVVTTTATTLCVCDVYAKWCGPCVALGKRISNLSSDYLECATRVEPQSRRNRASLVARVARLIMPPPPCYGSYDVKWLEVCADDVARFREGTELKSSKPLFVLYKGGAEIARMDSGANANELARLLEAHAK
jgi:thiol-disulfide isomerase/thioredoxin